MNKSATGLDRAIVIGASISGLLAARALANHFTQVIVVERDTIPPAGQPRKGVPQGRHLHVLLARGRELLEGYFPGLTQQLIDLGANAGDLSETVRWFSSGGYTRNFHSGLVSVQVSRPLLEDSVRQRLAALPNVTILENHEASELISMPIGAGNDVRITGIKGFDRNQPEPVEKEFEADLVVNAGGRGSHSFAWLLGLGYPLPNEEQIKVGISYTTIEFRRLPEHAGGQNPIIIQPSFQNRRSGSMLAVEGGRWIAGLSGYLGVSAPADLKGFIEYARSLDAPDIYDIVKSAEPLTQASQFKYPASQRRYYEKLKRFPEGLLVCGDAICSFNPIYGQGMTTAACEAEILDDCLRAGLPGLARRFFRRAGKLLDSPWSIAAGGDLAYPEVEGKRDPATRLINPYFNRLFLTSQTDAVVNLALQRVTNLIEPPASLFRPKILLRVLASGRKS